MASRWLRWPLRAAYAFLLAMLFVVSAYVSFSLFVRRGVTRVPELVGLTETEAAALANDSGLDVRDLPNLMRHLSQHYPKREMSWVYASVKSLYGLS